MNVLQIGPLILVIVGLPGCGGGSTADGVSQAATLAQVPAAQQGADSQPSQFAEPSEIVPRFDCNSPAEEEASEADVSIAGVWSGILVDCVADTRVTVKALVRPNGEFRIIVEVPQSTFDFLADQLSGTLRLTGDLVSGAGLSFRADSGSTPLSLDGVIGSGGFREGRLDGRWRDGSGAYGVFAMLKDDLAGLHPPLRLQDWPAEWDLWIDCCDRHAGWVISDDGAVTGDDDLGCVYAGQADVSTTFWFYPLDLAITGCLLEGRYLGTIQPTAGPFNDRLYVAVDDGERRALLLTFLSR